MGGVLVSKVGAGMPAAKAGIEPGDIILSFDGRKVDDSLHLRNIVAETAVGEETAVEVLRDGARRTLRITPAKQPERLSLRPGADGGESDSPEPTGESREFGFQVQPLSDDLAEKFGYEEVEGVLVTRVAPNGPAAGKLRTGSLIVEVEHQPVSDMASFYRAMRKIRDKEKVLFRVLTGEAATFVSIKREDED